MGISLLFAAGKRPDSDAIAEFASSSPEVSLTHDPAAVPRLRLVGSDRTGHPDPGENAEGQNWVELLREGLTFDLVGLAPGESTWIPEIEHCFDFPDRALVQSCEALQLLPGPHLAGGERSLPVVRGLMALARDLAHHFEHLGGLVWPHSHSVIGKRFFESTITAWLEGGAFPALGLTAFTQTADGALQSVGLNYFIDQELRIEPPLANNKVAATRLAIRLINQLVLMGGIADEEHVMAPDGSGLILRLSENRRFVRVWNE
ncbi:MAG: hypothetical protein A3J40_05115 [Erythrobacter sp. RIFCSPHIGHO2_12_FULL_63_10]|nr:MAG: hypothetical protein A3J40_05115 [Erythrobacter sp. RIFCSPHIGHO2_12_FULL_63_10]